MSCDCEWTLGLPQPVKSRQSVTVGIGQQERIPLHFELPKTIKPALYELAASFKFSTGEEQTDRFAITVLPPPEQTAWPRGSEREIAPSSQLASQNHLTPVVETRTGRIALFDPKGLMNPGKIVRPARMDDRDLFRFKPGYAAARLDTALDWSEWTVPGARSEGFAAAVEMCNNNGHCRKFDAGTMCPSFRVTRDEAHLTRGRANTLRLALSGQLGTEALASDSVKEALDLCVSCKGCKRECPTGVDMARMKIEVQHHYKARHGHTLRDKLIAHLPRYAGVASRFAALLNLRNRLPWLAKLGESATGFSA